MATKEGYEPVAGTEESEAKFNVENNEVNIPLMKKMPDQSALVPTNRKFLYIAACIGNLSAFVCGTAFGWTSPELPKLQDSPANGNPLAGPITDTEKSWVSSLLPVGATFGPFIAGVLADKIGRKNSLLLGGAPFVVAFAMAAFTNHLAMFFIMRLLSGLAVGIIFTVLPMYIGEIAEDAVRDSLGSFMQLFIVIGLLFSYALGPYMPFSAFNIICMVAPCAFLVSFYVFIPESPYYLITVDKDQASQALMKLRAKSQDAVQDELDEIKRNVEESMANKAGFLDVFKSRGLTKALILSVGLIIFQQFSGINIVLFFAQSIFKDAKTPLPGEICTIILGVVQVVASGSTPFLVEKKGKRFLLILSALGMAVSQGMLALFFFMKSRGDVSAISWLPVMSLLFYITTYCVGFGPLPWAVMGELFPGNIKSAASTVTAAVCWFFGFLLTQYFAVVTNAIGADGSFGFFAICCVAAAVFVYKFLPDTSGKSLQEIQDILNGNVSSND